MALVGSISGSLVAITGSVSPGADNLYNLGGSSSKWLNVVATSITGSLTRLASGVEYLKPGSNITLTTGSDGSVTIAAAGGGGGSSVFTEASSTAAYTTSSIAVGFSAAASSKGTAVFFAVSGSDANVNTALFSGPVVSSGSFSVKSAGTTVGTIDSSGVVSGSALQTVGNLSVQGTSALTGDVTFGGNIVADGNEAKSIFTAVTSNAITIGGAGSSVDVSGTLRVVGNQISGSGGGNITLQGSGDVAVAGDLTVSGNDIVFTAAGGNIATAATSLNVGGASTTTVTIGGANSRVVVAGDLEVQGTTVTVSASNLVIEDPLVGFGFLSGASPAGVGDRGFIGGITGTGNNVAFIWSNSTNAFAATKTVSGPGDSSVVLTNLQPIRASSLQVNGASSFVTSSDGSDLTVQGSSSSVFRADAGPVTIDAASTQAINFNFGGASSAQTLLQLTGANTVPSLIAYNGKPVTLSGSSVRLDGNLGSGINFRLFSAGVPSSYAQIVNTGSDALIAAVSGKNLVLSGTSISLTAGSSGFSFQNTGTSFALLSASNSTTVALQPATGYTTFNLATATATVVNFGTAATSTLNLGHSSGATWISGSVSVPGSFNALGNVTLGDASSDRLSIVAAVTSSIIPSDDVAFTLGTADKRWQHIYTGDLHLRNERGDYTLIEETDFLSIRFNKNGKRYKFLLERVPELDEPAR